MVEQVVEQTGENKQFWVILLPGHRDHEMLQQVHQSQVTVGFCPFYIAAAVL